MTKAAAVGLATLLLVLGLLALGSWAAPARAADDNDEAAKTTAAPAAMAQRRAAEPEGGKIYRAACATCHGINGDGMGREGRGLAFPPTNFRLGMYKLRTTAYEKLPTGADLERTIREGMSGTEMVPFKGILTEASIRSVAAYISAFSERFADPDETADAQQSLIKIPAARPAATPESVEAGREVYEREECDTCHGEDGDGKGPDAKGMTDDWDRPIFMLDWRAGVFKSGGHDRDLYRSIAAGMNGTPMEAYSEDVTEEERWQLVDFVRSLERKPSGLVGWAIDFLFVQRPSGLNYGTW